MLPLLRLMTIDVSHLFWQRFLDRHVLLRICSCLLFPLHFPFFLDVLFLSTAYVSSVTFSLLRFLCYVSSLYVLICLSSYTNDVCSVHKIHIIRWLSRMKYTCWRMLEKARNQHRVWNCRLINRAQCQQGYPDDSQWWSVIGDDTLPLIQYGERRYPLSNHLLPSYRFIPIAKRYRNYVKSPVCFRSFYYSITYLRRDKYRATHHCLNIPELAARIISHLPYGNDVVSMTRTNRYLSDIALDWLWSHLGNYVPLVLIFPKNDMIGDNKENVCIKLILLNNIFIADLLLGGQTSIRRVTYRHWIWPAF